MLAIFCHVYAKNQYLIHIQTVLACQSERIVVSQQIPTDIPTPYFDRNDLIA